MSSEADQKAGPVIAAFGGIRPMAAQLGAPVSTVQGWKQRDTIPAGRMDEIRAVARESGITLPDANPGAPATAAEEAPAEPAATTSTGGPDADPGPARTRASVPSAGRANVDPVDDASRSPAPSGGRGGGTATAISLLALVIAIGGAGWSWWTSVGPGADTGRAERIVELESRIAELERAPGDPGKEERAALARNIAALRAQIADVTPPDLDTTLNPLRAELEDLSARVRDIGAASAEDPEQAARIAALEAEIQDAARAAATNLQDVSGGLEGFEDRLATLTEQMRTLESRGANQDAAAADVIALTVAAGQVRRAVERGTPFADALDTLRAVSGGDSVLNDLVVRLSGFAASGVSTREELVFAFPDTATAILDNAPTGAESGIVDQILDRAQRIVRVRRVGAEAPPDSLDGLVARAEIRLEDGDVAGAVAILETLEGAPAEAASDWLARASDHVAARTAADGVEGRALARLREAGGR